MALYSKLLKVRRANIYPEVAGDIHNHVIPGTIYKCAIKHVTDKPF